MRLEVPVLAVSIAIGLLACSGSAPQEAPPVEAAPADPLNILFITTDDLGLQLGVYGERRIQTPELDQLAAESARFEVAYVAQASCSPSRSAMFTGMHTHSTGQYGLTNTGFALHPHLTKKTLPALLKAADYRTGIIGKLHVNPPEAFPFDYAETQGGKTRQVRWVAERAREFLSGTAADERFFLMVNFSDPHAFRREPRELGWHFPPQIDGIPENPTPPSDATIFDFQGINTEVQQIRTAGYLDAAARVDYGVGLLLDELEASGRADDTIIVFISDHGPPFARGKTTVYEAGVRIPFIVRWPGVSEAGHVSDAMVSTIDVAPTLLDAAQVDIPDTVQGRSLRPVVAPGESPWRDYLVAEFHFHGSKPFFPRRAIRDDRYKLIHNLLAGKSKPSTGIDGDPAYRVSQGPDYAGTDVQKAFQTFADPPEFELYDLEQDPVEFHNLAGDPEYAEIQKRLTAALLRYRRETSDPFLNEEMLLTMLEEGAPATRQ